MHWLHNYEARGRPCRCFFVDGLLVSFLERTSSDPREFALGYWHFTGRLVCGNGSFMKADKGMCVKENVWPSLLKPGVGVTPSEGPPVRPGGPLSF